MQSLQQHSCPVGGSRITSAAPKAQTRLCLHPFHRGEVLLWGLNCCSLRQTQQPVPSLPREGGRSKPVPASPSQGPAVPARWLAAPHHCYGSPGNIRAEQQPSPPRSFLSIRCSWEVQLHLLCYSYSSSSSWNPSASSLPAKPAQLPPSRPRAPSLPHTPWPQFCSVPPKLRAQNKAQNPDVTSLAPSTGNKLLAPLQMQLNC